MHFEDQLLQAWNAQQAGDLSAAAAMYGLVLNQGKERTAVLNLGSVLRSLNRLEAAQKHYQRWIPQFPGDVQLVANAANCCLDLNQPELALAWISSCLKHAAGDPRLRRVQA